MSEVTFEQLDKALEAMGKLPPPISFTWKDLDGLSGTFSYGEDISSDRYDKSFECLMFRGDNGVSYMIDFKEVL